MYGKQFPFLLPSRRSRRRHRRHRRSGPLPLLLQSLPHPPHAGGFLVLVQVGLQGKGLVASAADEGFCVGVRLDVGAEV